MNSHSHRSWTNGKLQDLVFFQRGFDITKAEQKEGDIPVISSSGVTSYHNEAKVCGPGIIIGRKGSLGTVHYSEGPYWPHDTTLWSKDIKGNNPRYIYYFLKTLGLERFDVGNSNPTLNRNHIHDMVIKIPSTEIQQKIVEILTPYDDLIENNRRRIQLLEEAARLLYQEWFVRLRFPGHEHTKIVDGVPEGWDLKNLFEITSATYGHPFRSKLFNEEKMGIPVVRIRDIQDSSSKTYTMEDAPEEKLLNDGDFIIGMDGEFHMNFWTGGKAWLNQRVVKISPISEYSCGYIRYAIENSIKYYNSTIVGTTVSHLGAKHLKEIRIMTPPNIIIDQINEFFETIRFQIISLRKQNMSLQEARDLLLPRLMNGVIPV